MTDTVMDRVRTNMVEIKQAKRLTWQEIAGAAGCHPSTIHRYLSGENDITLTMLDSIAQAMNSSVYRLVARKP